MRHALSIVMLRAHSDQALVAMARNGNESAFTVLVERYRGSLLALARRLGDTSRAEDAVQQGLMQAWAALRGGAVVKDTRPWLHQIVRHATYAPAMRARPEEELPETLAGSPEPHATLERRMHLRSVTAAIQDLPDNQRSALLQTAFEGRSNRDVANDLGLSESAVRQLVHRARTRLRQAAAAISPLPGLSWIARRHAGAALPDVPAEGALPAAAAAAGGGIMVKAAVVFLAAGALATGGVEAQRALGDPHPTPASVAKTRAAMTASRPTVAGTQPASSPNRPYDQRAAAELHRARLSQGATPRPAGADPATTDQANALNGGGGSSDNAPAASTDSSSPTANDQPASTGGTDASQPPGVNGGAGTALAPVGGSTATTHPRPNAIDPTTTVAPTVGAPAPDPDAADPTDAP